MTARETVMQEHIEELVRAMAKLDPYDTLVVLHHLRENGNAGYPARFCAAWFALEKVATAASEANGQLCPDP